MSYKISDICHYYPGILSGKIVFMKSDALNLIGKNFALDGNVGNIIEIKMGCTINPSYEADLDNWEIKSQKNDAKAWITLGGKKTDDIYELYNQVYNKIKNVLFFGYDLNSDATFTITNLWILSGLNYREYLDNIGTIIKIEERSDGQRTMKVKKSNFIRLYNEVEEYD